MTISIVVPAYNEEGNVEAIYQKLKTVLKNIGLPYEIIFVNDGSKDKTKENVIKIINNDDNVILISFVRNFGHQFALMAGYEYAKGDIIITLDCDLQHPPELIPDLIKKYKEGYQIVNTVRIDSNQKSLFKKYTSKNYYKIFSLISGVPILEGSADYRLIDKDVLDTIKNLQEYELFLRGMFYWLGYRTAFIEYTPNDRFSGKTKYNLKKMIGFAINGITSFSVIPLKIATITGFVISGLSLIYMIFTIYSYFIVKDSISGWTSLILSVLFIGGIQLISIGILGEYIGKIFIETKKRPRYIIESIAGYHNDKK